jgi:hypothetical protein
MYGDQKGAPIWLIDFDDVFSTFERPDKESDEVLRLHLLYPALIGYDFDVLSQAEVALRFFCHCFLPCFKPLIICTPTK